MSAVATATACVAAALLGGAGVAQRRGMPAATAGPTEPLLPRLVRSGWWWAGTLASLLGLGLQVLALTLGSIIVVQVALISSIVWTTVAEWVLLARRPTGRGGAGTGLIAAGLAATLLALDPVPGPPTAAPSSVAVLALGAVAVVTMLVAVTADRIRVARGAARSGTAMLLALATGIGYGITAVQLKTVGAQLAAGPLAPLTHPSLYVAVLLGPAAVLLSQHALHRGRLVVAVVAVVAVVDPVVGLVAGVGWFGESVATAPAALLATVVGVMTVVAGLVLVQTAGPASPVTHGPRSRPAPTSRPPDEVPTPLVTATRFVLDGWPVHIVIHDREGGWRVLGEQVFRHADERPTQWTTLVELDSSLGTLPPLPHGTLAHRPTRGDSWVVVAG